MRVLLPGVIDRRCEQEVAKSPEPPKRAIAGGDKVAGQLEEPHAPDEEDQKSRHESRPPTSQQPKRGHVEDHHESQRQDAARQGQRCLQVQPQVEELTRKEVDHEGIVEVDPVVPGVIRRQQLRCVGEVRRDVEVQGPVIGEEAVAGVKPSGQPLQGMREEADEKNRHGDEKEGQR